MKIRFVNGENSGAVREFSVSQISIGREDGNDIQLLAGGVSRYHACINCGPDKVWRIVDLDSTNGVKLNGEAVIGDSIIGPGDKLVIGEQQLEIVEIETASVGTVQEKTEEKTGKNTSVESGNAKDDGKVTRPVEVSAEKLLAELKSAGNSLFKRSGSETGAAEKVPAAPSRPCAAEKSGNGSGKRLFNIVFYFALIVCAACAVKMFMAPGNNGRMAKSSAAVPGYTMVYFERIDHDFARKSAFRLELKIEDGKMHCILDDVHGQRHFERKIELAGNYDNELDLLIQKLKGSGILTLKNNKYPLLTPEKDLLRLVFVNGREMCDIKCSNMDSGVELEKCKYAIRNFLNSFGLGTISQSREEVEEEAKSHLRNAIEKRENYVGDLSLLREAAREFEAAISCYEQFTPPPPELKQARLGFAEVNELRKKKLAECQADFARAARKRDHAAMADACQSIMKIAGEKSRAYREAAEQLLLVKRTMNSKRR